MELKLDQILSGLLITEPYSSIRNSVDFNIPVYNTHFERYCIMWINVCCNSSTNSYKTD